MRTKISLYVRLPSSKHANHRSKTTPLFLVALNTHFPIDGGTIDKVMQARDRPTKRPRPSNAKSERAVLQIPTIQNGNAGIENSLKSSFNTYKAVLLPNFLQRSSEEQSSLKEEYSWKNIHDLYHRLNADDAKSWCIETADVDAPNSAIDSKEFLQPQILKDTRAYCSFLVQHDPKALNDLIDALPVSSLQSEWTHEPCVWIFFGRNSATTKRGDETTDLQGRPEHTDSISHDGTWHFQLSGTKRWMLRPTPKLLQHLQQTLPAEEFQTWSDMEKSSITVNCEQGDVLVINTKLWFHQTILPMQSQPSVSYARDFWTKMPSPSSGGTTEQGASNMTNVDGLYATNDIEAGTVVFREDEMPDCELHRSKDTYNCEVVELEDGTQAVVSTRDITAGEFFCLEDSDGESEFETDDDDDDDADEEEN